MPSRQYQDVRQQSESPLAAGRKLMPAHQLGGPLHKGDELEANIEAGHIAQRNATVHQLVPGITGSGIGPHRKGRKGKTR